MQSLCSKGYSVLAALQVAVEKFVCTRVFYVFRVLMILNELELERQAGNIYAALQSQH